MRFLSLVPSTETIKGGELLIGSFALLLLVAIAAWTLFPVKDLIVWPDATRLLDRRAGSVTDEKRQLVVDYRQYLSEAQSRVERLTRQAAGSVVLGVATVGIWAWYFSDLGPKR